MTPYLVDKYGEQIGTTSVEVQIDGSGGTFKLPDDSILRGKRIVGMFVQSNTDDNANSVSGRPLAGDAAVRSSYVTLKQNNDEIIFEHPLSDFLQVSGDREIRILNLCNINPQKCDINVTNASLVSDGESIVLQFIYVM